MIGYLVAGVVALSTFLLLPRFAWYRRYELWVGRTYDTWRRKR